MNILITGGTGFLGRALVDALQAAGHQITLISRNPSQAQSPGVQAQRLDELRPAQSFEVVINLAGSGIADQRWSDARKQELLHSRVHTTAALVDWMRQTPVRPQLLLSGSAIGWYGQDRPDRSPFTESDPPAMDFLGDTCRQWEQAADAIAEQGIRTCKLRTGIVLGLGGGALKEYDLPLKLGIAPILGPGNQMLSWIHIRDLCRMYIFLLEQEQMSGVFNATAPNPVSNETFGRTLAQTRNKNRFIALPVPAFVLKLVKGESSIEVLKSTTVSAHKIKTAGFVFQFPTVQRALENIYSTL
mgnify:CR=1 FL=1